jgi:hypothetical protein
MRSELQKRELQCRVVTLYGEGVKMVVAVDPEVPDRVAKLVASDVKRERGWLVEQRLEIRRRDLTAAQRRAAIAQLYAERDDRRRRQDVLATRSALVSAHLSRLMTATGWAGRTFRPVPDGQDRMPGRRWGTSGYAHHRGGRGRLTVLLPDELGEHIRRASYWVSLRATSHLQRLSDQTSAFFPLDLLREMGELAVELYTLPDAELAAAVQRRARTRPGPIVSTGDLIRAAVYRATSFIPAADQTADDDTPVPA